MSFSRLAVQRAASASALRPAAASARTAAAMPAAVRFNSSSNKPTPEAKASSLIDSLPGNSLVSKTGWVTLGTGLGAVAISQELYVANEESIIAAAFFIVLAVIGKNVAKPYGEWADGQIEKVKNILNSSRQKHTQAVQSRIDSVEQQKDVTSHTQALFNLAKETAQNESQAFELKQRTDVAAEVKAVLDSWVRYEGQQREEEQRQLAKSVIEKVAASLRDEKTQKQILDDAVAEIESLVKAKAI